MKKNFLDDMVEVFGYDYVIGHCLCSEYDVRNKADREEDPVKKASLNKIADRYGKKADQLTRERVANGL